LQQQLLIFKNGTAFTRRLYNSVYFRYRKDTTGNLDEVQIENIAKLQRVRSHCKRKEAILKSIDEQNLLNGE
jgi:transcriptional accessory protein Tex/SPT6